MSRVDLTHILAPAALQPRTSGPRDAALPHAITVHQIADDDVPPPAAPAVHFTPRPGAHIDAVSPPKGKPAMATSNRDTVLAIIKKEAPITRARLTTLSGLTPRQLEQTCYQLASMGKIKADGPRGQRQYGLPTTKFSKLPAPEKPATPRKKKPTSAAKPAKASAAHPAARLGPFALALARTNGTSPPQTHTPDGTRAIATRDGGAVILEGGFLVAELTPAQTRAVQALA